MRSLLHQVGHNSNWNKDAFDEGYGDGLIFSPVHQPKSSIEALPVDVRKKSLFDPQFYLPNSRKSKFKSYDFFPENIGDGFDTKEFQMGDAKKSAKLCVNFQIDNGFRDIIVPARFIHYQATDFTKRQEAFTVIPFLDALKRTGKIDQKIYLTLPLLSTMFEDQEYLDNILNWITSFSEIEGVYLMVSDERKTKQIISEEYLFSYATFVNKLKNQDLEVILGYCNTESLLFSLIADCEATFGTFENTRIFSVDKFLVNDEERRGPQARIYLNGLCNWVQLSQAKEIKKDDALLWRKIYRGTEYADKALAAAVEPKFNQPDLYKHHFVCLYKQVQELQNLNLEDRYKLLKKHLKDALKYYEQIDNIPISLEKHGSGDHIQPWINFIDKYYKKFIKT